MPTKKQLEKQGSALAGVFSVGKPHPEEKKKAAVPPKASAAAPVKQKKTHMNIDITEFQEYLKLISAHSGISMSAYLHDLIAKDQKKNRALFEKLQEANERILEAQEMLKEVKV